MTETSRLLPGVLDIIERASDAILEIYRAPGSLEVTDKEDSSPLTRADMAAHRAIVARLGELTPDVPVLSEESAEEIDPAERATWQRYWLVDPLDGTKEFIKRNGEFTVNIALIDDHRPVLGAVKVPDLDLAYYACDGEGAFRREGQASPERLRTRALGDGPITAVASRSHRDEALERYLQALGDAQTISCGSSLKFCRVAEGAADIYPRLSPTAEWDTGAAQAVVEMAGGGVCDLAGRPLRYNTRESTINPPFLVYGDAGHDWTAYLPQELISQG